MNRLYQLLARVLQEDPKHITDQSSPDTLSNWDSFNGLLLVDELEKEFKVSFTMDEVMDVRNVADIKRHLKNHGVTLND
jgi:acyl carrier protein